MRSWVAMAILCACGRVGFDASAVDGGSDTAAAQPTIVGTTSGPAVAPGASVTVFVPTDTAPGDLLLLVIYANQAGATISPPGPWTTAFDQLDSSHLFRAAFYERRVAAGDSDTYSFGIASSNLVGWALTVVRDAPPQPSVDASMLLAGQPSQAFVTYTTPAFTASASDRVVALFIDDSGSTANSGAWADTAGAELLADGKRVAIYTTTAGPGQVTLSADVSVPNTTSPGGAVRLIAWE